MSGPNAVQPCCRHWATGECTARNDFQGTYKVPCAAQGKGYGGCQTRRVLSAELDTREPWNQQSAVTCHGEMRAVTNALQNKKFQLQDMRPAG